MLNEEVIEWISRAKRIPVPVLPGSHFFMDLAFDSLGFIAFLIQLEKHYGITFDIAEIEECLLVSRLIELIEIKVKECSSGND